MAEMIDLTETENEKETPFLKRYKNLIYVVLVLAGIGLIYWYGTISAVQKECICDYEFKDIKLQGGEIALFDHIEPVPDMSCNSGLMKIFDANTKEMSFVCNNNEAWIKVPYYKGNMTFYYIKRNI